MMPTAPNLCSAWNRMSLIRRHRVALVDQRWTSVSNLLINLYRYTCFPDRPCTWILQMTVSDIGYAVGRLKLLNYTYDIN
jgi:hypothetical protein